jgi:hypothetical protein
MRECLPNVPVIRIRNEALAELEVELLRRGLLVRT